jgi:hypothetical protein
MLNVAGSNFDFGRVIFAVLQECEHRRRGFTDDAREKLSDVAAAKLAEIHESYVEAKGSVSYWQQLEHEIFATVMPQYIPAAIAQSERERTDYGLWRGGDIPARFVMFLCALLLGVVIIKAPFIPIFEQAFAFFLAFCGWFYPEIKRWTFESRHSRLLNRLIVGGEAYQKNTDIHYLSDRALNEVFDSEGLEEAVEPEKSPAAQRTGQSQPQ